MGGGGGGVVGRSPTVPSRVGGRSGIEVMRSHIYNGMFKICRTKTKAQFNRSLVLRFIRFNLGMNVRGGHFYQGDSHASDTGSASPVLYSI